jgi:hypothetical protein
MDRQKELSVIFGRKNDVLNIQHLGAIIMFDISHKRNKGHVPLYKLCIKTTLIIIVPTNIRSTIAEDRSALLSWIVHL